MQDNKAHSKFRQKYKGNKTMTTEIIREWILKKLQEDPILYGGDGGNPANNESIFGG